MCASPYDYTGPLPAEGLGFNDRVGSILGGPDMEYDASYEGEVTGEMIEQPAVDAVPGAPVPELRPTPEPTYRSSEFQPGPPSRAMSARPMPYRGMR